MSDTTDGIGRRTFVRWAGGVIGAAAVGAGAFGTRGLVPHTSGGGPKDLTMSWWAEGNLSKLHVDVVKRYESMHRGVSVQAQYQPLNGYDDKLSTEMSGGNQPDVFMLRGATFAEYISRGAVRQLDDLVPGTLPFDSLPASLRAAAQYKGRWYAIPLGLASSPALIGNETLFRSVGIATPRTDWATEDFESVMQQVVKGTGGRVYGSNDMCGNEYALTSFLAGKKKPLFGADGQPGFDHDDLGTWLERWEKYRTDGLVAPMKITSATTGFTTDPLVVGKAAITLAASSKGINGYQPLVKDTLALLAYPREDANAPTATTVGPIEWFALSSRIDAAKAQQAAELAMAFVNDRWALRTLNLAHGVPLFASTRKALYPSQSAGNKAIYDNVQAIEDAGPAPVPTYPPGAEDFLGQLGTQNQLVGFGKTSISKAVDAVFADARRTLA